MPLVSVVIPITNYESELVEAVNSVMNQTFTDFEVVLVDNYATTKVRRIAEQLEEENKGKLRIVSEKKKGAASARNRGIIESIGKYIALLDSDDRMKPNRIAFQLKAIESDSEISLVGSWKDDVSPDGKTIIERNCRPAIPRWAQILWEGSEKFNQCPLQEPQTSSFFFEKKKGETIGFFDERFDPYWLHDTFFVYQMYLIGKVFNVPIALSEQRLHTEEDARRRIFDLKRIDLHGLFYSVLKENHFVPSKPDSELRFRKLRSRWLREAGIVLLSYRHGTELGKELIVRALKEQPISLKNWETFARMGLPRFLQPLPYGIRETVDSVLPGFVTKEWARNIFQ